MRRSLSLALLVVVALAVAPGLAQARFARVASYPVTFAVQNVDRSKLICGTDGASYEIKGFITGPKSKLSRASRKKRSSKRAATLYLHGLGFGEWFWHPNSPVAGPAAIPLSSNYVLNQAEAGHVSVTIDRLGYDASGHPEGLKSCLGGQADIAHQVIQALRSGKYSVTGTNPVRFKHVALAGHSIGGEIAMLEAYSFKDIDALAVISFSYQNLPFAQVLLGPTYDTCTKGGEPADAGLPTGYAYYGAPAPADFQSAMFHNASPAVLAGATPLRNRDPCGDTNSIIPALLQQGANLRNIKVPVLLICGTADRLFSPGGCNGQAARLTKNRKVTVESVRNAGHAITLDAGASTFRRKIGRWLEKRGF
jgi:pimeloyl-ACP methyl ester carboxylesterase